MTPTKFPMRFAYYLESSREWESVLGSYLTDKIHVVAEICPGWSPKIPLALTRLGFTGKYLAIDQSLESLRLLEIFSRLLQKQWIFRSMCTDLVQTKNLLLDFVVANHIIDDLALEIYCRRNKDISTDQIFSDMQLYQKVWGNIIADADSFENQILLILQHFCTSNIPENGICVFSQYISYPEQLYSIREPSGFCLKILSSLRKRLSEDFQSNVLSQEPMKTVVLFRRKPLPHHRRNN
jgi:hypothetical protein